MARTPSPAREDACATRIDARKDIDSRIPFWVKSSRLGTDDRESGPLIQNVTIEVCVLLRAVYRGWNGRSRDDQFLARGRATRAGIAASAVARQDLAVGD